MAPIAYSTDTYEAMDWTRFAIDGQNTPWVAVTLERTDQCRFHTGLLYRDSAGDLRYLHFGWHRRLYDNPYKAIACAIPPLDVLSAAPDAPHAMLMSAFCEKIGKHAPERKIPYNLKYDEDVAFSEDGDIIFGPNSTGLGCATFVLAVFRSGSNPLV